MGAMAIWQQWNSIPSRTTTRPQTPTPTPRSIPRSQTSHIVAEQVIYNEDGRIIYRGDVDLLPTLTRIAEGRRDEHETDGGYYRNYEKRLPVVRDRNYYREYVVRTNGYRGTGPQRLVLGGGGEVYYTPDHYQTFRKLDVRLPN